MVRICIVGLGNMGSSILDRLANNEEYEVRGCDKGDDLKLIAASCDVILIAVKPQDFQKIDWGQLSNKLVISIMAGVSVATIGSHLNIKKVVRVMPNLALKVGEAFSGWFCDGLQNQEKSLVKEILRSFGNELEVSHEDDIDKITALSGSGPAYYYFFNHAVKHKAIEMGFSDADATKIADSTFFGASKLLASEEGSCEELISKISSKGGTTEAALKIFDEKHFSSIVDNAIDAAFKRASQLGK